MEARNRILLIKGAKAFGIVLTERSVEAFDLYLRELLKWNRKMNLTAIRSEKEIVVKHFIDSLAVVPHLSGATALLDIGSGAGFPGLPIKMVMPDLEVVLLESVQKKVHFQSHVIRILRLQGVKAIHGRAQDEEVLGYWEGRFDAVVARAFSDLKTLLRLGNPFLKSKGLLIALKGPAFKRELTSLSSPEVFPLRLDRRVDYTLPFTTLHRTLLLFRRD
ncbi:MAG: 16S rRNA (guanine(527)-N(7))-methyltransferase RsmG [Desulfobacterota bacterium]|nr:16S rRNA (guanine(527)-N(7))-methyltransferase RsmG [Thermodesulfobacteriota bacterium]